MIINTYFHLYVIQFHIASNLIMATGNSRAIFYKKLLKKGNYNLHIDNQEIRRQHLLQFQKQYVCFYTHLLLYLIRNYGNNHFNNINC